MYDLKKTDPEFAERFEHFAFDEVINEDGQQLEAPVRCLAILAVLLGCGGVGRMMAIEAVREGGELTIAVRDADIPVAKALCEEIKQNYNSAKVGFCLLSEVTGDFDLMVNATPVGMYPNTDASPLTEETLGRITLNGFFDAIYNPRETKLMKMVSDKGVKKVNGGMQMLVWQAAVAHTIWSGAEYTAEQVQAISDEMMRLV